MTTARACHAEGSRICRETVNLLCLWHAYPSLSLLLLRSLAGPEVLLPLLQHVRVQNDRAYIALLVNASGVSFNCTEHSPGMYETMTAPSA